MEELLINYGGNKKKRIVSIIIGIYLLCFCGYFSISEAINKNFDILFFTSLAGAILSIILVLVYIFSKSKPVFKINNVDVISNPFHQKTIIVEWVNVNQVNFGPSYITFKTNGGKKEAKVDLSYIMYKDVNDVKAKIIELCEYKNIPYSND